MDNFLKMITDHYLESRDFNGYPFDSLFLSDNKETIIPLIESGDLEINYGSPHLNFHIKALPLTTIEDQVQWIENNLNNEEICLGCLYPSEKHLKKVVSNRQSANKPFSRRLFLGEPQLTPVYLDPEVMSQYVYNPQYRVTTDNISGSLFYKDNSAIERPYLPHFGYGVKMTNSIYERCLVVYLYDLHKLPGEEQQIWKRYLLKGEHGFSIHPEYYARSMGYMPERFSIFDALIEELKVINQFTDAIYEKKLFTDVFEERPRHYQYMHIPSEVEYYDFVKCLSNVTLDNINSDFFSTLGFDITRQGTDDNGDVITINKSKKALLREWIDRETTLSDPEQVEAMFSDLGDLYSERSQKSHNECSDVVDKLYYNRQREMMLKVYKSIRLIRLILANHTRAQSINVPDWLYRGDITTY